MSLLDKLRAEHATMTAAEKAEMAELLGVTAPVTAGEAPVVASVLTDESVCLQCGLEHRYNQQRTPRIAASSDDGSDDGWGVGQGPTGLTYCVQCRARTQWGPRPKDGMPLPGEAPNPELRELCRHLDGGGLLTLCRVATATTEAHGGFVLGPNGTALPRHKVKAGRARFMCRLCGQQFDGKRDELTRTGWQADMDKPIAEGEVLGEEPAVERIDPQVEAILDCCDAISALPPEAIVDMIDVELVAERMLADQIAGWREAFGLPLAAFDIRKWGAGCAFKIQTAAGVSKFRAPSKHFPRLK